MCIVVSSVVLGLTVHQQQSFIIALHQELDTFGSIIPIKNIPSVDYCYKLISVSYPPKLTSRDESADPVCHKDFDSSPGVSYYYKGICVAYRPKLTSREESADNVRECMLNVPDCGLIDAGAF